MQWGHSAVLALICISTLARRNRSREVDIGKHASTFLSLLDDDRQGHRYQMLRRQMHALAACRLQIGFRERTVNQFDAEQPRWHAAPSRWPGLIVLSPEYYEDLNEHSVPVDGRALSALKGSALALDIYNWLAYRLRQIPGKPVQITWSALMRQFAHDPRGAHAAETFRQGFLKALHKVLMVYPKAKVTRYPGGLELHASSPPVAPKPVEESLPVRSYAKVGVASVASSKPSRPRCFAAMNMAIRGLDFNFGGQPGDTLLYDLHPDLRADYVMANPPFNMKERWNAKLENDWRWLPGCTPPQGNANFAWLQHMLAHLAPTGSMALLLANGSMSSNPNNEGEIRKALVERDYVECMVALPGHLFTNTQIPACIWFLTRDKANGFNLDKKKRDRRGQFLFIDARQLGYMKDRVLRDFTVDDIQKVAGTFHAWQQGEGYADVPGYCYSASLADIRKHEHVLAPGR